MSTIKTETLSTPSNATVPVDTVVNGTAKAWVNFNGTGTVAIRRAFNVSSITDNGTGSYTVNFTTAMADANYAPQGTADYRGVGNAELVIVRSLTTTSCKPQAVDGGSLVDVPMVAIAIFS